MMDRDWQKAIGQKLEAEAIALSKKWGCDVQIGCAVNNVGRVVWSAYMPDAPKDCERATLAEAVARATYGMETARQRARRLRREAADAITEAEKLEKDLP